MSKLALAALPVLILGILFDSPSPAVAESPVLLASSRCNDQTIDEASARVADYDRHAPGSAPSQLLERYGAIAEVMALLNEEREALKGVCSNDAQRTAFFERIAATMASALVLEADVAARLNASCPAAAQAFPTMMLADAWLSLANVVNEQNGSIPAAFNDVIPRIQRRSQAVALTLPSFADTSQYWRDQVHTKAKAAITTCPSPSPRPSDEQRTG